MDTHAVSKGHKILLETKPEDDAVFVSWCGAARWAYNYGLSRKLDAFKADQKLPRAYGLASEIVSLKREPDYRWLATVPKSIPRMSLLHLDAAYEHFFRSLETRRSSNNFPRFKTKKRSKLSFHLETDSIAIKGKRVRIPKIGWRKMHQEVRFEGKPVGTVCISKRAGRWYVSVNIETKHTVPIENQERTAVGLDVGIKTLATLSDGTEFENPKPLCALQPLLARAQRQMARKHPGSNGWQRSKLRVERICKRISDVRANSTHGVSSYVAKHYKGVAIEDLNTQGMLKNHNLAKSIMDANFNELHRQLKYKMSWRGGEVRMANTFFPSSKRCSKCGFLYQDLLLSERRWTCPECGVTHKRDVNAAKNLLEECFGPGSGVTAL